MERAHHVGWSHGLHLFQRPESLFHDPESNQVEKMSITPYCWLGELAFTGVENLKLRDEKKGVSESFITSHATNR